MALELCIQLLVYILRTKTTVKNIKLQSVILLSINIGTVILNLFSLNQPLSALFRRSNVQSSFNPSKILPALLVGKLT